MVEVNGESHKFSIGNGPSVLVNHLLTGRGLTMQCAARRPRLMSVMRYLPRRHHGQDADAGASFR
jgi:hypothetical protein